MSKGGLICLRIYTCWDFFLNYGLKLNSLYINFGFEGSNRCIILDVQQVTHRAELFMNLADRDQASLEFRSPGNANDGVPVQFSLLAT